MKERRRSKGERKREERITSRFVAENKLEPKGQTVGLGHHHVNYLILTVTGKQEKAWTGLKSCGHGLLSKEKLVLRDSDNFVCEQRTHSGDRMPRLKSRVCHLPSQWPEAVCSFLPTQNPHQKMGITVVLISLDHYRINYDILKALRTTPGA